MDLRPYVPKTFDGLLSNTVAYIRSKNAKLTNWKPGSRIRTLIEAVIFIIVRIIGDFQASYNYAIRESCYQTFRHSKLPGKKAVGFIRYVKSDVLTTFSVPIFTISLFGVRYRTVQAASIVSPATYVDIDIIADEFGTDSNIGSLDIDTDQGNGDILDLDGNELQFDRIFNPFPIEGGEGEESDEAREVRFQDYIQNLARSTLGGIRAAVLSIPGVVEAYVEENINPLSGVPETGHVNIYISDGTSSVSPTLIQTVFDTIQGVVQSNDFGYKGAGVELFVGTIEIQAINVDYEIDILDSSGLTDEQVEAIASTAIAQYVNRLSNGDNVVFDLLRSNGLASHPDFVRLRLINPIADIDVPSGKIPKIGGSGGGTIVCSAVFRIPKP